MHGKPSSEVPPTAPAQGFGPLFAQEAALRAARSPGGAAGRPPASPSAACPRPDRPLCPCLCVSWHLCLCESHSCFPTSFPSPRGGGAGRWERGSVLFSPRTIRAGKGWSQGRRPRRAPPLGLPGPREGSGLRGPGPFPPLPPPAPPPPPSSPPAPGRTPPPITHSRFRSARRVRGVGATCEGAGGNIWLPRPPGMGLPPLPQASASRVAQPQGAQEAHRRCPGAQVASHPLT